MATTICDKARVLEMLTTRLATLDGSDGVSVLLPGENAPASAVITLRIANFMFRHLKRSGPTSGDDRCEFELRLIGMVAPSKSQAKGAYAAAGLAMKVAMMLRDWGDTDGTSDWHRLSIDTLESTTLHGEESPQEMFAVEEIVAKGIAIRTGGSGLPSIAPLQL